MAAGSRLWVVVALGRGGCGGFGWLVASGYVRLAVLREEERLGVGVAGRGGQQRVWKERGWVEARRERLDVVAMWMSPLFCSLFFFSEIRKW